jgi:hypothetical protein
MAGITGKRPREWQRDHERHVDNLACIVNEKNQQKPSESNGAKGQGGDRQLK